MANQVVIQPQPGPQTDFLSCPADVAIYGGAAGGGKSFGLLLDPLRHFNEPEFGGVIFRRTIKQVKNEGGLWDEAMKLYTQLGARPKDSTSEFIFPSKMRIQFAHLEYEKDKLAWQGAQIPFIGFDELTHFTESQFFYMLSRNRSASGIRSRVRCTTNPDARSWVRKFIEWWIDPATGYAIPERSGKLRWFIRRDEQLFWADSAEEIYEQFGRGDDIRPISVTFIPARLDDNKILIAKDPAYRARLLALSRVERMQLLDGNWNVTPAAGLFFRKSWFEVVDALPHDLTYIRHWDRAATEGGGDWTVGLKLGKSKSGLYYVADVVRGQWSPGKGQTNLLNTARLDSVLTAIGLEQDPGSAGVADIENMTKVLGGFDLRIAKPSEDKITRAKPISAQVEAGNVKVLRAHWNDDFFTELENFPEGSYDDQVDALSGAFNLFTASNTGDFTKSMAESRVKAIAPSLKGDRPLW